MSSSLKSSVNRIFDYFVVCGLDVTRGLEPNVLFEEQNAVLGPLDASFSSRVISHFPDKVPGNTFDGVAITTLCMPQGVHFSSVPRESHENAVDPVFHPFVITKENGSRIYGFALTFYEEVHDETVINAVASLQKMHTAQLPDIVSRHCSENFEYSNTRSLPRHFKLSNLTLAPRAELNSNRFEPARDQLLVTKCIALVSQFPFVEAAYNFLTNLYWYSVTYYGRAALLHSSAHLLSPESYVYHLLYSVPLPPTNQCIIIPNIPDISVRKSSASSVLVVQRPSPLNELPLCDYSFSKVIELLGIDGLLQLWTCLLLESQVLLYSKEHDRLMLVAETVSSLLFPFVWPHVYVPILPAAMYNFLDAPVPYLMGLSSLPAQDSRLPSSANLCMVDIDNGRVDIPEELPAFPQHRELADELNEVLKKLTNHSKERTLHYSLSASDSDNVSSVLQRSEAYQRVAAIAKRTGVIPDNGLPYKGDFGTSPYSLHRDVERYLGEQRINNAVREVFLNRFAHMFAVYEHFVIQPNQDMESWLSNREMVHTFDKTTFLSDQPGPHLPFLSRFLESQMFASFIDAKVLANFGQNSHNVRVLDARIKILKDGYGDSMVRTPGYETCTWYEDIAVLLERRLHKPLANINLPSEVLNEPLEKLKSRVAGGTRTRALYPQFPDLEPSVLSTAPTATPKSRRSDKVRKKEKVHKSFSNSPESLESVRSRESLTPPPAVPATPSPAVIAQGNWKFVEQLLQECKMKTKRLLVGKMGSEAIELGHGQISVSGVEDNTLIAGLCDLLERVWAHGLQAKQGKSSLWSHLVHYHESKTAQLNAKPVKASSLTPAYAFVTLRKRLQYMAPYVLDSHEGSSEVHGSASGEPGDYRRPHRMKTLPVSLVFDMRNVQSMTDIKTHLGYARAWVRLCLEKKLLFQHLTTLLNDERLLRTLYKRYAFLRCEDERDQFLYYLLSLNAVDYHCFTHTYTSAVMTYRVLVVSLRQSGMSSCKPYFLLSGTLQHTQPVHFPFNKPEFVFQHKNLGILTTLRMGMDDMGTSGRWLIDYVLVRNEITGQTFKFPCGHWLGRDVEDGSTERLLVAEAFDGNGQGDSLSSLESGSHASSPTHGTRARSPSTSREGSLTSSLTNLAGNLNLGGSKNKPTVPDIQRYLGDAVNNMVKYFHRPVGERGHVTPLLCGELGLVPCLEMALLYGFRSSRLFSKNLFLWDFFMRVREFYCSDASRQLTSTDWNSRSDRAARTWLCDTIGKIQNGGPALGKDGKLQLLLCLAARDKMLHRIIPCLATSTPTASVYDESSFLRDPRLCGYLHHILQTLADFDIVLEASIVRGIE